MLLSQNGYDFLVKVNFSEMGTRSQTKLMIKNICQKTFKKVNFRVVFFYLVEPSPELLPNEIGLWNWLHLVLLYKVNIFC